MMTLDEAIKDIRMAALLCEIDAGNFEQHGGSFYEEKAKACRAVAEETYRLADWLEELQKLREGRPQGEWIDKGDYAECSNCGADSGIQFDGVESVPRKTNFCPNCGAKMKGADDDN